MARLPTVVDLGPTPRADPARPVANYAAGGEALAAGARTLGTGIAKFGEGVGEYALDENRWDYAKSDAHYETGRYELKTKLSEDPNYGPDADGKTMPQRYESDLNKLRDDAAGMIRDPNMRERFRFHTDQQNAREVMWASSRARGLENNASIEYVRQQGDNIVNKGVVAPDDETSMRLIDTHNGLIDGLVAKRAITPVQALEMKKTWAKQFVTADLLARIESDPADAIRRLQGSNTDREANFGAADSEMQLTPQERALYQRHLKNLYGPGGVDNKDGSRSTLFNVGTEIGGKYYNLPSVYDGKILPPREAVDRAVKEGLDKFPSYANQAEAEARYGKLHDYMEKDTATYLQNKGKPASIYDIIPPDVRHNLLTRARSANDGEQELVRQDIKNDIISTLNTGQGVQGIDPERVRRAFGPQGDKLTVQWQQQRSDALAIHTGTSDMPKLNEAGLAERVENYRPADGAPGYERKQRVYEAVGKQADAILKQRYADPAAAVASDPKVKATRADAVTLDPSSYRPLAKARMDAQAKLGIPEELRTPLTKDEALKLTTPLSRMLPGQERDVLTDIAKQFQEMFGEDADTAFEFALRQRKMDNATSQTAARVMKKLGLGQPIGPNEARTADQAKEVTAAEGALALGTRRGTDPDRGDVPGLPRQVTLAEGTRRGVDPDRGDISPLGPAPAAGARRGVDPDRMSALQPQSQTQTAKPGASGKEQARMPSADDIIAVRRNPKLTERFDAKYGKGSAKKILDAYPVGVPGRGPLSNMITGGQ